MDTNSERKRRNKSWPEAVKREIVAASFAPGASVSTVARAYDVNANQVFAWRKQYSSAGPALSFVPVAITSEGSPEPAPPIEIVTPGGYRLVLATGFDASMLGLVLDMLRGR